MDDGAEPGARLKVSHFDEGGHEAKQFEMQIFVRQYGSESVEKKRKK